MKPNLMLYVASYADGRRPGRLRGVKDAQDGDFAIVGAAVITRDEAGKVEVKEHGATPLGWSAARRRRRHRRSLFAPPLSWRPPPAPR